MLPAVLSTTDLPEPELRAARLDGELFAVGECFGVVGDADSAHLRGASLAAVLPARLIAEGRTAAWVHGAIGELGVPLELCVDSTARYRWMGKRGISVREVILDDGDTRSFGGMIVTTPLRTAIDLTRCVAVFAERELRMLRALAEIGCFGPEHLGAALAERRHLPNKARALARVRVAFGSRRLDERGPPVSRR